MFALGLARAGTLVAAGVTAVSGMALGSTVVLGTTPAGDASYSWNTKYGPWGYDNDELSIGVGFSFGGTYGNDRTVGIFEIPISALAGKSLSSATLEVNSEGFGTGYYYGSAVLGWLDVGTIVPTGDVIADALGGAAGAVPNNWPMYNSDFADVPGIKSFDVTSVVLADLAAGRSFSSFVLSGSRDTYGSVSSAESGSGPRIVAVVPEPTMLGLVALAGALATRRRQA